tara:strand:- start:1182 stop:2006 length:825 start_codon:yes stop_codon:yes gene_type:complete
MKNLATFKNEVCLIAGSGLFALEAASFLNTKGFLKKIILLSKNNNFKNEFKKISFRYDIRDLEKIITDIKKENIKDIIIIGYVDLPPINEIKLSLKSKFHLSKDFFLKNINQQSLILKRFLNNKNMNLLSQKKIFRSLLINRNDQIIKKDHKSIVIKILNNLSYIKKIFNLNLAQSFIMNGNRVLAIEDFNGTNNLINRVDFNKIEYSELVFIKSKKKEQIDEIDFPVIGSETIDLLLAKKFKLICLFNYQTIVSNKSIFLKKIKNSNISLLVI